MNWVDLAALSDDAMECISLPSCRTAWVCTSAAMIMDGNLCWWTSDVTQAKRAKVTYIATQPLKGMICKSSCHSCTITNVNARGWTMVLSAGTYAEAARDITMLHCVHEKEATPLHAICRPQEQPCTINLDAWHTSTDWTTDWQMNHKWVPQLQS